MIFFSGMDPLERSYTVTPVYKEKIGAVCCFASCGGDLYAERFGPKDSDIVLLHIDRDHRRKKNFAYNGKRLWVAGRWRRIVFVY